VNIDDLKDPVFWEFVRQRFPEGPVPPDPRDIDATTAAAGLSNEEAFALSAEEAAKLYRQSQARKIMRLYDEWQASLN
jgi:hypothetical protein